ncbi:PREDICTED: nuclear body protein SP140-like protein [Myotis brandtii]|uniref:nuclear body protein SP140-like protein n=1 Tax=Myotis brandtii TaxID=109478 RepID=UPI0007041166|nr:PREDICTED: nuclear body protein SP140-like protein [Myotis brandtii]
MLAHLCEAFLKFPSSHKNCLFSSYSTNLKLVVLPTIRETGGGKMHTDVEVDYTAEILPVTCGEMVGMLIKRKLKRGATVKCIRREDGNWYTPREFEVEGGYEKSSNWKNSVYCGGTALKNLKEYLPELPGKGGVKKKLKNAAKCKICEDEGKLFNCSRCFSFFHEDCHIPPVDTKRIREWRCTFCTIKVSSRSQQCCSESEVLERQMGPEEKLKCECLLLNVYYHLESIIFPNIPHEHYVQKASQCLKTLKGLDEIKKSLTEGHYLQVEEFVLKINNIFQDHKHNDSDLTEEEFKKNFKDVFAIQ